MKRRKVDRLVRDILAARDAVPEMPVTFDTLEVNFVTRTVRFRGRTITVEQQAVTFPVLSTDRLVFTQVGEVL